MLSTIDKQDGTAATSTLGPAIRNDERCYITALSTDVIYYIVDFIPYESQLNFACTCRRIADCSSNMLKRHQEAFKKFRVASDISPTTMPTLLRSVFGRSDPLISWHVRSIEIWYDRRSWLEWKPLDFDQPWHEEDMKINRTPWTWQDNEVEQYLENFEDKFSKIVDADDEDFCVDPRAHFTDGLDGIVKALVIAHCPGLRDITFITTEHKKNTTLGWLRRMIQASRLNGRHWPPGLCRIENVAVGVESDTWMSRRHLEEINHQSDHPDTSMEIFSSLLHLPRMTSIYYNDLRRPDYDDQTEFSTLMPPHCSKVKHIFLDGCGDVPYSFRCALTTAPRALETFTLRAGNTRLEDADQIVSGLSHDQADSLHTVMFYGPYTWQTIHGYRCSVYRNEELEKAVNLKTVAMHISDLELDCYYSVPDEYNEDTTEEEYREYFIKWFCETAFPPLVERLAFWGLVDEFYMPTCAGKFLDWLEDALINAIQSRPLIGEVDEPSMEEVAESPIEEVAESSIEEVNEDDQEEHDTLSDATECHATESESESRAVKPCWGNLKAIYLEEIERQYSMRDVSENPSTSQSEKPPWTEKIYFGRLVEVAKEAGIDVYTITNRAPAKHAHDFPKAPDKYDLRSGPWYARRDEIKDWVFDVYKGRLVPPGCGKCGRCEQCLGVYSEALWKSVGK